MNADQLIAAFKALPLAERHQVIRAISAEEDALTEMSATAEAVDFVERWKGKFSLAGSDPEDARLTFLLDRFSN